MLRWSDREPRPNVRVHPLDAYEQELRGEVDETDYEGPEAVIGWLFAALVIGVVLGAIAVVA